jgi:hypothetical protein
LKQGKFGSFLACPKWPICNSQPERILNFGSPNVATCSSTSVNTPTTHTIAWESNDEILSSIHHVFVIIFEICNN